MVWNSESQVKLVFVLPVNKTCAFPSVHLMETRDLLMMITPGEVPPLPVLPQPSSLRSAQFKPVPGKSSENVCPSPFSREEKIFLFQPGRDGDGRGRQAHGSCLHPSTRPRGPGGVCAGRGARRDWYHWASSGRRQTQGTIRDAPSCFSELQPVHWNQKIWMGVMLFTIAEVCL